MTTITAACHSCGAYGPVAMLATDDQTRQFALCRVCADTPAAVGLFAARFNRDRWGSAPVSAATPARADDAHAAK
ncbi:MAG TPA: hypothetical protein VIL85_16195 [Thermomicrobiales bacterium]|jgi:hypothetical protein